MKMSLSIFQFCPFCWQNEMVKLAKWQNEQNENVFVDFPILPILLFLTVCLLYHFVLPAEWAEWADWENRLRHFHSAHSASLLILPFRSASRMGRMGKSTKTFSFCSFCSFSQFANFTISFCQQNGQNGKIDKDIFILLIVPVC